MALFTVKPEAVGDFGDGPDARADDHHVGLQAGPVLELEMGDPAVDLVADDPGGDGVAQHLDAHALDGRAEHVAGLLVELRHHQLRRGFEDGDLDVVRQQPACRLESQQTAADDRRPPAGPGVIGDAAAVVDGAEQERARSAEALHRRHERPRSGGDDDVVVRLLDERGAVIGRPRRRAYARAAFVSGVPTTTRRSRSMRVALTPAWSVMPLSRYHESGFMKMSGGGLACR